MMGVAGCGKSSLGKAVAAMAGLPMIEGDDYHSPDNVAKMRSGIPLTDSDRANWLDVLAGVLSSHAEGAVLTCSALKRAYRDRLRAAVPDLKFVFLDIDRQAAHGRVQARAGEHLFPPSLVESQFVTLESPLDEAGVLRVCATDNLDALSRQVRDWMAGDDA